MHTKRATVVTLDDGDELVIRTRDGAELRVEAEAWVDYKGEPVVLVIHAKGARLGDGTWVEAGGLVDKLHITLGEPSMDDLKSLEVPSN